MRIISERIKNTESYAKALHWGKLLTIAGTAQASIQVIGLVSGILIIRLLSIKEYALYTLANTMLGTMVMLSDGGIATGVMAQGGKVWNKYEKLGSVLNTGLNLRKKFAAIALVFAVPILLLLLHYHSNSWVTSILITLTLIPAFLSSLSGTILEVAPKLSQQITVLQKIQVFTNLGRLSFLIIAVLIFPFAFVAILANGIPQLWANWRLKKLTSKIADLKQNIDPVIKKDIYSIVKRMLPDIIFYCLSGQITIWLISVFGSTTALAQVGALGRISVILTVFSILFGAIILPRFARLANDRKLILTRYLQISVLLVSLSIILIGLISLFSQLILKILGPNYINLKPQLLLFSLGSCISFIAGSIFFLSTSRGWVINPIISILASLISIVSCAMLLDFSSLNGILILNISLALTQLITHFLYGLIKIERSGRYELNDYIKE